MKYVCIDDGAVEEFISGREYQSIDFGEGAKLIDALSGNVRFLFKQRNIVLFQDTEGAFLMTLGRWDTKRYVVIDCQQSSIFTQLRSAESLTTFQKLLRFSTKYWNKGIYNNSEKIISGTSKAILFPLPFSADAPFRIAIERHPWRNRLKKRGLDGNFWLVYKSGYASAKSSTEVANETNFRKVLNRLPEVYSKVAKEINEIETSHDDYQMASTDLHMTHSTIRSFHLPFANWLPLVTENQQRFINSPQTVPHRLQGPAGTGKTLSLILRTIRVLLDAERAESICHALLVTHSEATREAIQSALYVIDQKNYQLRDRRTSGVSLSVETLASLCAKVLQQSISESEFVDRDAQDSKILQHMYIEQAIAEARQYDFSSFRPHLSPEFVLTFENRSDDELAALLQHEISILIKGRSGDSFEIYKKCPSLKYGFPIENDADKGFVFSIYRGYQKQLEIANQFDTDDVVISAVGQLDTPIWRRRRSREGFDFMALDETHLFNINELHVFHHFTRDVGQFPISFTIDQSQAVGDRGWNDEDTQYGLLSGNNTKADTTNVTAVFRSSPQIREFCYTILASGATLFTNFANTLSVSQSAFTAEDERRSQRVKYIEYPNDESMVAGAFQRAEILQSETSSSRSDVLVTCLSDTLMDKLRLYASGIKKGVTILMRRGDFTQLESAEQSGHFVLGHVDFVGGLEFNCVVIVGVDKGRVPQESGVESSTKNFYSYAAHNRLYVASSRAKYALQLLGEKSRGASDLLKSASKNGLIDGISGGM